MHKLVQFKICLGAAVISATLSACGGSSGSHPVSAVAGSNTAVVMTKAADFSGADIQLVTFDAGYTASTGSAPKDQSDYGIARFGENFYHIGRYGIDTVTKYNFNAPATPVYEYSTLKSPEDPTGNPSAMVFVSEQKAYITQYGNNKVLIVNPSAQTEAEFITGELDLSGYADSDTSGASEANSAVIVDGKLFVVMQRLVNFSPAEPNVDAYIAVFNINTDQEIDTDPSDPPENRKGIKLNTRNPGKFVYRSEIGLFLPSTGDAFYSFRGREPGYTGGISKIDTDDYSVELILDDGDADNHPYGFIYNLEVVDASNGYFVGYQSYQNYNLYHFNPATGVANAVSAYTSIDITVLNSDALGNLWIGISDSAQPRIELIDGAKALVETIGLNQNPGEIALPAL